MCALLAMDVELYSPFQERSALLRDAMEQAYVICGKSTKRSIKNLPLSHPFWGDGHDPAFNDLHIQLRQA